MVHLKGVLCNTVTEFDIPLKLFKLIKKCLTHSKTQIGKYLSDRFTITMV